MTLLDAERTVRMYRDEAIINLARPAPTQRADIHTRALTDERDRRIVTLANWLLNEQT